jgi:hypothetical protein
MVAIRVVIMLFLIPPPRPCGWDVNHGVAG